MFKNKYLKYKSKYLQLKVIIGSDNKIQTFVPTNYWVATVGKNDTLNIQSDFNIGVKYNCKRDNI